MSEPTFKPITMAFCLCAAQDGKCFYCGRFFHTKRSKSDACWTRDHLHPKSKGGHLENNTVLACHRCNAGKQDRLPTTEDVIRARAVHAKAILLCSAFNGDLPGWRVAV